MAARLAYDLELYRETQGGCGQKGEHASFAVTHGRD